MDADKRKLIEFLRDCGCLKFGTFRLKSGDTSPFFVNLGEVDSGAGLAELGAALAGAVQESFPETTLLFGPAYKGIALAAATATAAWNGSQRDLRFFYDRKEPKAHGEGGSYIGHLPQAGEAVVMIDDVLSNGGTKVDAVAALQNDFQAETVGIVVVVDRRRKGVPLPEGLPPVKAVLGLPDLCDWLAETGDKENEKALRRFYEGEPA